MAIEIGCSCESGNGNTGLPNCTSLFGVAKGFGLMNIVGNDGVVNKIDLSVASIGTVFSDLLTAANATKRLYPITEVRNITFPKEENQYETDSSGQKSELREGIQSFMGEKFDIEPQFVTKLKQAKCKKNGVYLYSAKGVQGIRKFDTTDQKYYFYPIEIRTFAPYYVPQTDGNVAKAMIPFDYAPTVVEGELWTVSWSDLGTTYEDQVGLMDVNYKVVDVPVGGVSTTVGLRLYSDYGSGLDNTTTQNVDGLVTASFTAINGTTGLSVAALAVTETPDDKYTFSWTSATSADIVTISVVSSTGYIGSTTIVQP